MLGETRIKQLAEAILTRSTADQTEVVVLAGDSALTRFANSTIHQNVAETDAEVRIRVVLGTRIGVATTNNLDDEALAQTLEKALAMARLQPYRFHLPFGFPIGNRCRTDDVIPGFPGDFGGRVIRAPPASDSRRRLRARKYSRSTL